MSNYFNSEHEIQNNMPLFSVIICSYNPDERILKRCLEAVRLLKNVSDLCEILLIDNNSTPALTSLEYVKEALLQMPFAKVIIEENQGLSFARQRGIQESIGKYLIFFDDDNEPFPDYLTELDRLYNAIPSVGAWGPGNVWVDYIDGIAPELQLYANHRFQERHEDFIQYACLRSQQNCYPFGTGLSIKREHALNYVALLSDGVLTLKDRDGNLLTSGGDTQIVLSCIVQGAAAGVTPGLKIRHIIPGMRVTRSYIKKLIYGTHICYDPSIKQLIPEHKVNFGKPFKSTGALWLQVVTKYVKVKLSGNISREFRFIEWLGLLSSAYIAENRKVPVIIGKTVKRLL